MAKSKRGGKMVRPQFNRYKFQQTVERLKTRMRGRWRLKGESRG